VISSLQFHDITRQQVEHVADVLDEVAAVGPDSDGKPVLLDIMHDIGELQIDQLNHAGDQLGSAIAVVTERLRQLARRLCEMSEEAVGLISIAGKEEMSFVAELTGSISTIVDSFRQNEGTGKELAAAIDSVGGMIRELSAFVNDIEEIGSEVKLIAINAQIKAAQAAEDGGALGVLAEAIRNLSDHATDQTAIMTEKLKEASDAALELHTIHHEGSRGSDKMDSIEEKIKDLLDSLRRSEEGLVSLLRGLDRTARALTGDIEMVLAGITADTRTNEVISGIVAGLRSLIARTNGAARAKAGKESKYFEELTSRYTMHQERCIHESHIQPADGKTRKGQEISLGDNVELF
jgi:methyl-accepting chemotaxis protein